MADDSICEDDQEVALILVECKEGAEIVVDAEWLATYDDDVELETVANTEVEVLVAKLLGTDVGSEPDSNEDAEDVNDDDEIYDGSGQTS